MGTVYKETFLLRVMLWDIYISIYFPFESITLWWFHAWEPVWQLHKLICITGILLKTLNEKKKKTQITLNTNSKLALDFRHWAALIGGFFILMWALVHWSKPAFDRDPEVQVLPVVFNHFQSVLQPSAPPFQSVKSLKEQLKVRMSFIFIDDLDI